MVGLGDLLIEQVERLFRRLRQHVFLSGFSRNDVVRRANEPRRVARIELENQDERRLPAAQISFGTLGRRLRSVRGPVAGLLRIRAALAAHRAMAHGPV